MYIVIVIAFTVMNVACCTVCDTDGTTCVINTGDTVRVECPLTRNTSARITWYYYDRGSQIIIPISDGRRVTDETTSNLVINNATYDDTGYYSCGNQTDKLHAMVVMVVDNLGAVSITNSTDIRCDTSLVNKSRMYDIEWRYTPRSQLNADWRKINRHRVIKLPYNGHMRISDDMTTLYIDPRYRIRGTIMCTVYDGNLRIIEQHLYGVSRLGCVAGLIDNKICDFIVSGITIVGYNLYMIITVVIYAIVN